MNDAWWPPRGVLGIGIRQVLGVGRGRERGERAPLLKKTTKTYAGEKSHPFVVRVGPSKRKLDDLPESRRRRLYVVHPVRVRRWLTVLAIGGAVVVYLGSLRGSPAEVAALYEQRDEHGEDASATVRSRSIFTCCLCVAASVIILVPRLACGPDDERGLAAGPGRAEEYVSGELRAVATLLVPWLLVGVPWDLANRVVVRGAFPYPLSLAAVELGACLCVAACLGETSSPCSRSMAVYGPLGVCFFLLTAGAREAARASKCGPRISAAFANAATGIAVLVLSVLVALLTATTTTKPSETARTERHRVVVRTTTTYDDLDDAASLTSSDAASPMMVRRRRIPSTRRVSDVDEDSELAPTEAEDECCCCCLALPPIPGVPNCSAAVALTVALGGAAIMALGEKNTPVAPACVGVLSAAQAAGAVYYVGFQEHFKTSTKPTVARGFLVSSGTAFAFALLAAIGWELADFGNDQRHRRTILDRPFGAWLVLFDVAAFALLAYIALLVVDRFSALVFVLFAAVRAVAATFAAAAIFGDLLTSLEYKGAMILVLGLVIYALEVSKALLDDPPRMSVPGDFDTIAPSPFLQQEANDDLLNARLRRSGFTTPDSVVVDQADETPPPYHHVHPSEEPSQ